MLESSTSPENPGPGERENGQPGDGSSPVGFGEGERVRAEDVEPSWSGNRWPRQETCALLEIRSGMDSKFRDSSFKAPLWDEVSRKMGDLGYNRSAKKCKEKFENIYKYHKRTRDGRSGRGNGKTYRFFEQLEALDHHSLDHQPLHCFEEEEIRAATSPRNVILNAVPCSVHKPAANSGDNSTSSASSSSQESEGTRRKKRKLTHFLERLMKEVVDRQESLQRQFVEVLEKTEQDRMAREEAWKVQELARIKRESDLLIQERSIAAAKDAAVLAFLKKFSDQSDGVLFPENPAPAVDNDNVSLQEKSGQSGGNPVKVSLGNQEKYSNKSFVQMSSSRWPKEEVDALIKLRTNLDVHYQENGSKGPLWEEMSASMKKLGYNRSAKRCKEKWENINKYFKRVKESNKRRVEDSKTCPYFHQLDALYNKKTKNANDSIDSRCDDMRPEELLMHMIGGQEEQGHPELVTKDGGKNENIDHQEQGSVEKVDGDGHQIAADNSASQMASDNDASMETVG